MRIINDDKHTHACTHAHIYVCVGMLLDSKQIFKY